MFKLSESIKADFHSWSSERVDKQFLHFDWLNYVCPPLRENKFKIFKVRRGEKWEFNLKK